MAIGGAPDFIPAVYRGAWDRSAIAGLAPLVLDAAQEGDAVAKDVVETQARELGRTAAGAVKNHELPMTGIPVALAGGVLLHSPLYRSIFLDELRVQGIHAGAVTLVPDPATGAVALARIDKKSD
jgi:N-acetylglucosamine kinase-like BadF-type ATPase